MTTRRLGSLLIQVLRFAGLGALGAGACIAPLARSDMVATPVLVLTEEWPWHWPPGFDSPVFALYSDGTTIFQSPEGADGPSGYSVVKLNTEDLRAFLNSLPLPELERLSSHIYASSATDAVFYTIHTWRAATHRSVTVEGRLWATAADRSSTPPSFRAVYDTLSAFTRPGLQPWRPEHTEVLWWRAESNVDCDSTATRHWPTSWAAPQASDSGRQEPLRTKVPSADLSTFLSLAKGVSACTPLVINGTAWRIGYRFPFPYDSLWVQVRHYDW
jgi:hypothetical protein